MIIKTWHDTECVHFAWTAEVGISKHIITGIGATEDQAIEKLQHHLRNHINLLNSASEELELRIGKLNERT